jgi:parallel beta-helix repeat protein
MKYIKNRIFALFFAIIIFLWMVWNPIWDEVMYQFVSSLGYPLSIVWISTPDINFFNLFNFFLFIVVIGLLYEFYRPSLDFEFNKNKKWTAAGIFLLAVAVVVVIAIAFLEIDEPGQNIFGNRIFEYPTGSGQIHVWPNLFWEFLTVFCMETVSFSLLFGILFMTESTPQKSKSYKIMLIGAIAFELFVFFALYLPFFITGVGVTIYAGYTRMELLQQYWFHWDFWSELVIFIGAIWLLRPQIRNIPRLLMNKKCLVILVIIIAFLAVGPFLKPVPVTEEKGQVKIYNQNISGEITQDQTWSGNILLTETVGVAKNVTLTIEPGTIIKFKHWRHGSTATDHRIALHVHGTMKAIGTPEKPIRFTSDAANPEHGDWQSIIFEATSTNGVIEHCIIEYGATGVFVERTNVTISNSIIRWSTGANIFLHFSSSNITHNRIYECSHGGIEMEDSRPTITYNTIWGNLGGIWVDSNSHPIIRHNIIKNSFQTGIGIANFASAIIENNTITGNEIGIGVIQRSQASKVIIKYNNIYGNKNVDIQTVSTSLEDVNATENWWGTTNKTLIESKITDSRCDPALRTVFYEPYLSSEVNIGTLKYDFENNETYKHLPGTENDTYLYIFSDDDTRKIIGSWHPFDFLTGIAWDGQYLWIVEQPDKTINKFDTSMNLIESFPSPATLPYGLTFDGEYLWLLEYTKPLVYQINRSGNVIKSIPAPTEHCMGLAWDGKYLWTNPWHENKLYKFNTSGNLIDTVPIEIGNVMGMAWDGKHLWIVDNGDDMIYETDPSDGRVIRSITTPADRTFGMAWQDSYLWCTDWTNEQLGSGRVFKILPLKERMTIDGLKDDWLNFSSLLSDPKGDNVQEKTDIKAVYGFMDNKYLYLMVEFYDLDRYHHMDIEMDFDNDKNPDYLLPIPSSQRFVSFIDLKNATSTSRIRNNVLFIPYSNIKDVYEVRMPLAFIENRSQFNIRIFMQGEKQTIDKTDWVYIRHGGE